MKEIYTDAVIGLAASLPSYHPLPAPALSGKAVSTVCGSKIEVQLQLDGDGRIMAFTPKVKACLIGQASAAIVQQHIIGLNLSDIEKIKKEVEGMLLGGPCPTDPPWDMYACLAPVRAYPSRFSSVLLIFEAVQDAITKQPQD